MFFAFAQLVSIVIIELVNIVNLTLITGVRGIIQNYIALGSLAEIDRMFLFMYKQQDFMVLFKKMNANNAF
jgi:hypothetical protein